MAQEAASGVGWFELLAGDNSHCIRLSIKVNIGLVAVQGLGSQTMLKLSLIGYEPMETGKLNAKPRSCILQTLNPKSQTLNP